MNAAVLLPTVSQPRFTRAQRIDYFTYFLAEYPRVLAKIDLSTVTLDCNSAVDTGLYSFFTKEGDRDPCSLYVYVSVGGYAMVNFIASFIQSFWRRLIYSIDSVLIRYVLRTIAIALS